MQAWYDLEFRMVASMILKTEPYQPVQRVELKTGHQFSQEKMPKIS